MIFLYFFSRSVMKERASMRRMMIKRCGSMDTMTVTNDKLDTRSHFSDPSDLNRKSAVVVTYSIDDDNQKDVWDISIFIGRRSIHLIGSFSLLLLAEVWEICKCREIWLAVYGQVGQSLFCKHFQRLNITCVSALFLWYFY